MPHALTNRPSPYAEFRNSMTSLSDLQKRGRENTVGTALSMPPAKHDDPLRSSPRLPSDFNFDDKRNLKHRQTFDHLVGRRDMPAPLNVSRLNGVSSNRNSYNGELVSPVETKTRAQYFEEQFQYKDHTSSARERVHKDSPIVAELRTNVIVS